MAVSLLCKQYFLVIGFDVIFEFSAGWQQCSSTELLLRNGTMTKQKCSSFVEEKRIVVAVCYRLADENGI
jgi:hypothetical protein